eukprot:12420840-Alexandrium_andersonii.AAC.1
MLVGLEFGPSASGLSERVVVLRPVTRSAQGSRAAYRCQAEGTGTTLSCARALARGRTLASTAASP